jgi:hypothetical protein
VRREQEDVQGMGDVVVGALLTIVIAAAQPRARHIR